MEKIIALIDKLQDLKNNGAALSDMAYYTQLLYAELMCVKNKPDYNDPNIRKKVAVIMPGQSSAGTLRGQTAPPREERVMHELRPAESLEERREPVPLHSDHERYAPAAVSARGTLFDKLEESRYRPVTETVSGKEINEAIAENKPSLNDRLKRENMELGTRLNAAQPVRDLSKAMGINDKFQFINELFRGDRNMFDRSVKTINECGSLNEAEYWIGRELKIKLGWQDTDGTVQQFYHLIRKRFS